jgi:hypothetical protein
MILPNTASLAISVKQIKPWTNEAVEGTARKCKRYHKQLKDR